MATLAVTPQAPQALQSPLARGEAGHLRLVQPTEAVRSVGTVALASQAASPVQVSNAAVAVAAAVAVPVSRRLLQVAAALVGSAQPVKLDRTHRPRTTAAVAVAVLVQMATAEMALLAS